MNLPAYLLNGIFLPLSFTFIGIILFSFFYMRSYRKKYEYDHFSFFVSVSSLVLVFILTSICPTDTFIVSEMKDNHGNFKDWASSITKRNDIENYVFLSYCLLYSLIIFFTFILLPFTYFFYDTKDDEEQSNKKRVISSLTNTLIVLTIPIIFVLICYFVTSKYNSNEINSNESMIKNFKVTVSTTTKLVSNIIIVLGGLGMINLIVYTGFGLSSWPVGLIKGSKSALKEIDEVSRRQISNTAAINSLKSKRAYLGRLNEDDENLLKRLESKEREDQLKETIVRNHLSSWTYQFQCIFRPMQIFFGVFFFLVSLTLIFSLIINNFDLYINGDFKKGFIHSAKNFFNPIDYILLNANLVYPLDYCIYLCICWYLIFCTLSGVRNLGINFFFYRIGKFKKNQTTPQGLVLASFNLMLSMLAINILMFSIAPNYTSFGNQVYKHDNNTIQCNFDAKPDDCTSTRSSYLIVTYVFSASYVSVFFYFATWFIVPFFILALLYSIFRQQKNDQFNEFDSLEFEDDSL